MSNLSHKIKTNSESMLYNSMKMGADTRDRKQMDLEMEMVNSFIEKEVITKVNGKTTTCMDMENYTIQTINQLMKVTGLLINFMVMEKYITTNLHQ